MVSSLSSSSTSVASSSTSSNISCSSTSSNISSSCTSSNISSSSSSNATSVTSVPTLVKTTPTVHLPITTAAATAGKPVMKVQPLSTELSSTMPYQHQQKSSQVVLATAAAATTTTTTSMAPPLGRFDFNILLMSYSMHTKIINCKKLFLKILHMFLIFLNIF